MKTTLLLILAFTIQISYSQNWIWSKKISRPYFNYYYGYNQLLSVKGKVYIFSSVPPSSYNYNPAQDTSGSFMQCFDSSGTLLFEKEWKIPFHIRKVRYDGGSHFYFSGDFCLTQTIDNITITSLGKDDGVVGQIDLNGKITWMRTFGGSGMDIASGICLDPASSVITVTGRIEDTLCFNGSFHSVNPQSAILCQYTTAGNLIRHRLYDFQPALKTGTNCGVEVCQNNSTNIFVLMDRTGDRFWSNDPGNGPMIGRYLVKLDQNLDTVWTKYLNGPQSYYGWTCNNLDIADNGDLYLTNECSGKYGGDADLLWIKGTNGNIHSIQYSGDGYYKCFRLRKDTIYLLGIEGANGCPCPASHPGYVVIKKITGQNVILGETRIPNVYPGAIDIDQNGIFYVSGSFGSKSVMIGPSLVYADSILSSGHYYTNGNFLSKLGTIECKAPDISVSSALGPYGAYHTFCTGDSAALTVNQSTGSFSWSNGATGNPIYVKHTGNYSVIHHQTNGCVAYSISTPILVNENIRSHAICMVTYNPLTNQNNIAIKPDLYDNLYDVVKINLFATTGSTVSKVDSFESKNIITSFIFPDPVTDPNKNSTGYFISTVDTCGTETEMAPIHTSMFLEVHPDANQHNVLTWNKYSGYPVAGYKIWNSKPPGNMVQIDMVDSSTTTYTDLTGADSTFVYQVEALNLTTGCVVNNTVYKNSRSNIAPYKTGNLSTGPDALEHSIKIFPNPTTGKFIVQAGTPYANISVSDILGQTIYDHAGPTHTTSIDLQQIPAGTYFIRIINENQEVHRRIIKN